MVQYRVATHCLSCGRRYRSTTVDHKKPPVRCKFCKSSQTVAVENPAKYPEFQLDVTFAEELTAEEAEEKYVEQVAEE